MTYDEAAAWQDNYRGLLEKWARCDLELSQVRQLFPANPGDLRPASEFVTCAAEPCETDATTEILHAPGDGSALWVASL